MLIKKLEEIVNTADKFKNSYFWSPPKNAAARRSYEVYYTKDEIKWIDGKDTYTASFDVQCSCRNIYAKGHYTKNGNKTTLLAIKNSLKRIKEAQNVRL